MYIKVWFGELGRDVMIERRKASIEISTEAKGDITVIRETRLPSVDCLGKFFERNHDGSGLVRLEKYRKGCI